MVRFAFLCNTEIYFLENQSSKLSIFRAFWSRFRAEKSSPQSFPLVGVSVTCFPASDAVKFLNQSNKHPAVKTSVKRFCAGQLRKNSRGKKDATEKNDPVRG
jgi:hypothetical protein